MVAKEEFKGLYSRYLKRFYLKTALLSLIISLSILLVLTVIFWIIGFKYYWISFILFAVSFGVSFLVLYLVKKPSEKDFYNSLEELDLEQRAITMYEYKNDDSLMAQKQRENTKISIESKEPKSLKIKAPLALIITVAVIFALSVGSSVASGLSANKVIPSANEAINNAKEEEKEKNKPEYEISFEVEGDGYIEGEIFQLIKEGDDGTPVMAVAEDGWYFQSWGFMGFDGNVTPFVFDEAINQDPYREIKKVKNNETIYAIFMEIPNVKSEDGEPDDKPHRPEDEEEPSRPTDDSEPRRGQEEEGSGEGGKYAENNQVIDGSTYYGDTTFDNAYTDAMEGMQNGEDGDDGDLKKIIGDYYETIEK